MMIMTIEDIPSYRVAYVRRVGPYGAENVQTMENLKSWARSNNLLNDESVILGIAQDNPEMTKPEDCRYDTCMILSNDFEVKDCSVNQGNTVGGKYVVFKIDHTAEAVAKAWTEIFPELLKQHYQCDESRPIMERYVAKMVQNHSCEICVPIL